MNTPPDLQPFENLEDQEEYFQLLQIFQKLVESGDRVYQEYQLSKTALAHNLPLEVLKAMFQTYVREEQIDQQKQTPLGWLFWQSESIMEGLNDIIGEMDFFSILEQVSKLSIVLGIIAFVSEIPEKNEQRQSQVRQALYQSWDVLNDYEPGGPSGGIDIALEYLNEQGASLAGVELPKVYLPYLELPNSSLEQAKLSNADLYESDFSGSGSSFVQTNFQGSNLSGVNFSSAFLYNANFRETVLLRANFQASRLNKVDFSDAKLIKADFKNASLTKANLTNADLTDADLVNADLTGAQGLKVEQVRAAQNWEQAIYDDDFRKKLEAE